MLLFASSIPRLGTVSAAEALHSSMSSKSCICMKILPCIISGGGIQHTVTDESPPSLFHTLNNVCDVLRRGRSGYKGPSTCNILVGGL